MDARLQFLISHAEYRANILRQKRMAKYILWKERLEEPLDEVERNFLTYQRSRPIPNLPGKRGRPTSGKSLSDAEYAVLRTSRLQEERDYLNPSNSGAPRKHDNATIALHIQAMIRFHGMNVTRAWADAQKHFCITKEQARYAWKQCGESAKAYLANVKNLG